MECDAIIVFCTMPEDDASALAKTLVEEHLAACVNLVPGVRSIYWWQDKLCDDSETLAIIKTTSTKRQALQSRLAELHPYDCPEILAMDVLAGHEPYLQWLRDSVK